MTNKNIRKAQKYSEKVIMRLMNSFYDHLKTITDMNQVDDKLKELNDKWLEHCERTPEMTAAGKDEFLRLAGQALKMLEKEVRKRAEEADLKEVVEMLYDANGGKSVPLSDHKK